MTILSFQAVSAGHSEYFSFSHKKNIWEMPVPLLLPDLRRSDNNKKKKAKWLLLADGQSNHLCLDKVSLKGNIL